MEDRKKRGLLLVSVAVPSPGHGRAAADRHRRLGRRRQVDADRAAALRLQADLRGPARAGRAGVRAPPRRRRRGRPRAADRRPARRARAGHHDRRRLPLLRHAAADVHHGRHPGPRPLHAQHGHGRVDGRPRARPGRRAQRDRPAVAPPRVHRLAAADPAHRGLHQQDGPRRLVRGASTTGSPTSSRDFAARLEVSDVTFIPISALKGDNVVDRSENMPWYEGSPLLYHLEHVHIASDRNLIDVRFPVQWVVRPRDRGAPRLPRLRAARSRRASCAPATTSSCCRAARTRRSQRIDTFDGPVEEAYPPMSVTVHLADDLDVSRGDMICRPHNQPASSRDVDAIVCWMSETPVRAGRATVRQAHDAHRRARCSARSCTRSTSTPCTATTPPSDLGLNEIGRVRLRTGDAARLRPLPAQPRDRRVHPHRRGHQRHRRRGHDHRPRRR